MAQLDDTIATYLTAIEVEGKTENTVLSYRASLENFLSVGRRLGFPNALDHYEVAHVYEFLGDLKERGASTAYRQRRHREVKTFFSWCRRMEYVEANVFAKVPLPKLEQKIHRPFSPHEIRRLLEGLDRSSLPGCRNYALILFLLDTGVRVSECVSIRLDDVDWERRRVPVRETKNKHNRWVDSGERTAQAMRDYVERFRGDRSGMLFLTALPVHGFHGHLIGAVCPCRGGVHDRLSGGDEWSERAAGGARSLLVATQGRGGAEAAARRGARRALARARGDRSDAGAVA